MAGQGTLDVRSFGPFTHGVIDRANAALGLTGALRYARGLALTGVSKLSLRPGTLLALTLTDDAEVLHEDQAARAATGGSATTVADTTQAWATNTWAGKLAVITAGPGAGQRAVVVSNTATIITVAAWTTVAALAVAPTAASTYRIVDITTPAANVTHVCALTAFGDWALAVAYSSTTQKAYLYKLSSTMDGWYDSAGLLHAGNLTPQPMGALWTVMTTPPEVTVAEGLGMAYIAHALAADANGLYWATKTFTGTTIATLRANLDGAGDNDVFFSCVQSFQQALWGLGFGAGAAAATAYRPEMARFSPSSFGTLAAADSITVGDRVRSDREKGIALGLAGNALIIGAAEVITRVTGFGRNSWYKEKVDNSNGVVGGKAGISDGDFYYFWSKRGPMRVASSGPTEPMWDPLAEVVSQVINPQTIVAARDLERNLIIWSVDTGHGTRTRVAYNTQLQLFVSSDDDWGLAIAAAGEVAALVRSTAATPPSLAPDAPPYSPLTDTIGTTTATAHWTAGDLSASTEIYLRRIADATAARVTTLPPGVQSYVFTDLLLSTPYEWSIRHVKNGQFSAYLGPVGLTQFTTLSKSDQLVPPANLAANAFPTGFLAQWTNSGETLAKTEVWVAGPSVAAPADSAYRLTITTEPGLAFAFVAVAPSDPPATVTYWLKVRHVRVNGQASTYAGPISVVLTTGSGG